jgi:glycosyltransferase involved in cell wall biosynthesis
MAVDSGSERKLRMGLVADMLASAGHEVVWWTSSFDHNYKRQRYTRDTTVRVQERLELRFLHARAYDSNISLARLINHYQLGKAFTRVARSVPPDKKPDIAFATMPIVELAAATAEYGRANGIPVIIDVRDLHPDIYLSLLPKSLHSLGRAALWRMYNDLRTSLRLATSIIAIAPSFLRWALRHARRVERPDDRVFPLAYPEIHAAPSEIEAAAHELESLGVRRDKKILWYVGTFNRWIDLETPISAARQLERDGRDDFQLVISGSGDFEPEWRRRAQGLKNIVFTGWIGVPHILHLRKIAWAGLAPYRPGFLTVGNKLFEYMAGGLPILLSIGGDARSIVESNDCGIGYDGASVPSFIDAVNKLDQPGVRSRMADNSLAAYREHYSAEKVYAAMVDYIEELGSRGVLAAK